MSLIDLYVLGMAFTAGSLFCDCLNLPKDSKLKPMEMVDLGISIVSWPIFWFFQVWPRDDEG